VGFCPVTVEIRGLFHTVYKAKGSNGNASYPTSVHALGRSFRRSDGLKLRFCAECINDAHKVIINVDSEALILIVLFVQYTLPDPSTISAISE
jgi:hypothetical protein